MSLPGAVGADLFCGVLYEYCPTSNLPLEHLPHKIFEFGGSEICLRKIDLE